MRRAGRGLAAAAVMAAWVMEASAAPPWEQRSAASRTLLTGAAVIANVVPVVPSFYVPQCLPGYVFCKAIFASVSLLAAADQLAMSGGAGLAQTRAIIDRGFGGDWLITGRHLAGEGKPQVLPEPPPPAAESGHWRRPPL